MKTKPKTYEELRAGGLRIVKQIGIHLKDGKLYDQYGAPFAVPSPEIFGPWLTFANDQQLIDALNAPD